MDYKLSIAQKLSEITELSADELQEMLEVPSNAEMGDFALPCFKLSKIMRKSPMMIADDLQKAFPLDDNFDKVESVKGYLNFFLNKQNDSKMVLDNIMSLGNAYGSSDIGKIRLYVWTIHQ